MTINDYLNLITSEHRDKPNYIAMVSLDVSPFVQYQNIMTSLIPKYDVDLAVGAQLDVIGQWVGVTRFVSIPISGVYFTWDNVDATGWDYGIWFDPKAPGDISVLPDDVYRNLIKARIAANHWDGTIEGAYKIWAAVFPSLELLIQDNQNMTMNIGLVGGIIDSLTLALLIGGYIPLKPEGVHINSYFIPVNDGPVFAWDVQSEFLDGWDIGSWTREITT